MLMLLQLAAVAALALPAAQMTQTTIAQAPPAPTDHAAIAASPINVDRFGLTSTGGRIPHLIVVLSFRNTSGLVADEVHFIARYSGGQTTIVDKGVFSPGILIQHQFTSLRGTPTYRELPTSHVQYVHFTNGTQWGSPVAQRPGEPASAPPRTT
jgi:hypothetical protein